MKQSVKFPNPYYRILAAALGFYVVALVGGAAHADTNRQGFYAGVELGFANPADMDSTVSGVNHPTQCDQLLLLKVLDPGTNVVPLTIRCARSEARVPCSKIPLIWGQDFWAVSAWGICWTGCAWNLST